MAAALAEAPIASEAATSLVPPAETAVLSDQVLVGATTAPPREPPVAADPPASVAVAVVAAVVADVAGPARAAEEAPGARELLLGRVDLAEVGRAAVLEVIVGAAVDAAEAGVGKEKT